MIFEDRHTHTTLSDGTNTPEEMVQAAIEKGMTLIGISDHSYLSFDDGYTLDKKYLEYQNAIAELREKYAGIIEVQCGIEQDYDSDFSALGFDYVIGAVHYAWGKDKNFFSIDLSPEILRDGVKKHFRGDFYAFAENYYSRMGNVAEKLRPDIIGHFDLVAKFNKKNEFFDPESKRYRRAWKTAADKLLKANIPFEINTAPLRQGGKEPFPSYEIIAYLKKHGAAFVLSSDSHDASTLLANFEDVEELII